ncbi:MAG TPA: UDP-N-acetylmuramoyl-L-alanyl-D-glutamate--2,6-diaminopimelate ligase [Ignavibacteria bacterium]|nr:UDP-N-acetylmuramoyl-L-alanyl-D-glutamate--2,6-diaminopimelate ligase [Ignavibacteria bacterium]HMR39459.1 UDP-N-acetylmuramoyl-L-alanyl-D-glutamate--2,6-diaminopimelate ligase [Ignavibacteria bacterium]
MMISDLINRDELKNYEPDFAGISISDFKVTGINYDSRKVYEGNIFFAIKGFREDGSKYIKDAVNSGAGLIFTDSENEFNFETPVIKVSSIRKLMATVSGIFYNDPSSKIRLVGITGTNGKTTTAYLTRYLFEEAGYRSGLIGTIGYQTGERNSESKLTTPDSVEMNMMLDEMVRSGMDFCVMEVSSIALVMDRIYGLKFDTGVFTNLTSEHIDFHKNMENYFDAKKILFDDLNKDSAAISNSDDDYGREILNDTGAKKFYYSVKTESDLRSFNEKLSLSGLEFDVKWNGRTYRLRSNLAGRFNIYNILASVSTALRYDIDMEQIQKSLTDFKEVDGRYNRIKLPNGAIAVIDYSHTSDSLKKAIETSREIVNEEKRNGKVITVFGCGGNRDKTKRPVMGGYAAELSDHVIITSDNPRSEEPMEIIREIITGIKKDKVYDIEVSREEAIKKAIEISNEGDIVLICGKGHETYQEVNGVRSHFDDKEMVNKYSVNAK